MPRAPRQWSPLAPTPAAESDANPAAEGGGCRLALRLHDFSAALAAAAGGAYSAGVAEWLCTEQDPSYSAPEVLPDKDL